MSRQFATNITTIYDIFCPVPFLPSPFGFRRLIGIGKKCEQRITKSLTELFWEVSSVTSVEEFPNRNCLGIHSIFFLCTIGDQMITYHVLGFGELLSAIITGNFTAYNF